MTEKFGSFDRIIGGSQDVRRSAIRDVKEQYENPRPLSGERLKTSEEMRFIEEMNLKLKEFFGAYGVSAVDVRPEHIHFVDLEDMPAEEKERLKKEFGQVPSQHDSATQSIRIVDSDDLLHNAHTVVHEAIHFSAFQSFTFLEHESQDINVLKQRRGGLIVNVKDQPYFNQLNEAITEELANRFSRQYFKDMPYTKKAYQVKERYRRQYGDGLDSIFPAFIAGKKDFTASYEQERENLWAMIGSIVRHDRTKNPEDVFKTFVQAALKGELLPLARMIESEYGQGAFRRLGKVTRKVMGDAGL